jgi:hypothetical protein
MPGVGGGISGGSIGSGIATPAVKFDNDADDVMFRMERVV